MERANRKYASRIEFDKESDGLRVKITYEKVFSREEEERAKDFFQWKAKQRGEKIEREKIDVHPKAGDVVEEHTQFLIRRGEELYGGLERVKRIAPFVFTLLIEDLNNYGKRNSDRKELVDYAVSEIGKFTAV